MILKYFLGLSPPPSSRRDVAGSDGPPQDRKSKAPTISQQLPHPVPHQQQLPVRGKGKTKEDFAAYDSRRSDSDDEQVCSQLYTCALFFTACSIFLLYLDNAMRVFEKIEG